MAGDGGDLPGGGGVGGAAFAGGGEAVYRHDRMHGAAGLQPPR